MAKQIPIFVVEYIHRHGSDIHVTTGQESAEEWLAETILTFWHERADKSAPENPEISGWTNEQVMEAYFPSAAGDESYEITELSITLDETPAEQLEKHFKGENPIFLISHWVDECVGRKTQLGYWEWVATKYAACGLPIPTGDPVSASPNT